MKNIIILFMISVLFLSALSACGESTDHPSQPGTQTRSGEITVTDVVMTTSVDDQSKPTGEIRNSFAADTAEIFCSFKVNNIIAEDFIKASWIYLGEEGKDEKVIISEMYDIALGSSESYYLAFFLGKPSGGWNKGIYEVVLTINNSDKATVSFNIE